VRLEEATVEKGNGTERCGSSAASFPRAVQGAEEERAEKVTMYSATPPQATVYLFGEELLTAAQPPLRLDEVKE